MSDEQTHATGCGVGLDGGCGCTRPAGSSPEDWTLPRDSRKLLGQNQVHTGSQNVTGYKPQSPAALALVNQVKQLEQNLGEWIEQVYFADAVSGGVGLDPRQLASARTHFEYALYHLNRAVFQPADPIGDVIRRGPQTDG